ncbi:MAG: SPOR domain-containing protein [Ignavibacteriaceae bacterium]
MMEKKLLPILLLMILIFQTSNLFAQEVDITPYLKEIENGRIDNVIAALPKLNKDYPQSSSVLFLDAVVTSDGQSAVDKYSYLVKKYPKSKYADAALYRIYTYYYAAGMYKSSKYYLDQLENKYPNSPYISIAKRNIPLKDKTILTNDKKPITESPAADSSVKAGQESKYIIQAGAFTVLANAQKLMHELESTGYSSSIEDKEIAGAVFHVVYADGFRNRSEAEKALSSINAKFNLDGRVLETN